MTHNQPTTTPLQRAADATNSAHDNVVQLYTLLDVLARLHHTDPTPKQARHLVHNLKNLEANTQALRFALIDAGMIDQIPIQDLLDAVIDVGRQAEHMADQWQNTGKPPTTQEQYQGNQVVYLTQLQRSQIAVVLDPDTPSPI